MSTRHSTWRSMIYCILIILVIIDIPDLYLDWGKADPGFGVWALVSGV